MEAAQKQGASHFVLLSAVCVQKPLLQFQLAKLAFEAKLREAGNITHSIVRPTAFFKSLAGQVCPRPPCCPQADGVESQREKGMQREMEGKSPTIMQLQPAVWDRLHDVPA